MTIIACEDDKYKGLGPKGMGFELINVLYKLKASLGKFQPIS
jgi:hypothetical protein